MSGDRRRWRRALDAARRYAFAVLVVVVLLVAVLGAIETFRADRADELQRRETKTLADCLSRYGDAVAAAIAARSETAERSDDAELDLFVALLNAPPTAEGRERARQIFAAYVNAKQHSKDERAAHPLPEPPRVTCQGT